MSSTLLNKKIEYWEHQLLDLGKRNKMINYRETKRATLKLIEPAFEDLFQRLAINEETLTFQRSVDRETDIRVFSILSLLENLSSPLPVTIGDIKAEGSVLERQKTLKNIRAKARLSMEEQGTNILYLSFGFIEWRDGKGASAQWIKSPLILVPAVLALEALNSPYTLSKHEDDIVVNPTLQYYLKTEYGIDLPNFDADKDTLSGYLESLEEIADQRGWRILKEVSLGLLSFLKISMYNDLIRNEDRIKSNPVIRAMSGDADEANDIPESLRTFDLDSIRTQDCYQVMSADSSQQDAILYSKNNISFVMQGPPGTGKSQTITNIIAEALADGKKVLFVSEKMAALQVVYRRLQDAHLADFCLPLHSYKANKKEILEQIGANLRLKQTRVKDTALNNLEELLAIRQELNQYAAELHHLNPELNISCYEVYSKLEEVNDAPSVTYTIDAPLAVTQAQLQAYLNKLKDYSLAIQRINCEIHNNPWDGLKSRTTGYEYTEKMQQELTSLQDTIEAVFRSISDIKECPNLLSVMAYSSLSALVNTMRSVCDLPTVPEAWLETGKLQIILAEAEELKAKYERLFALEDSVEDVFVSGIYDYDYNNWKDKLLAIANGFVGMPFIKKDNSDFFVENHASLHQMFTDIREQLDQAISSFDSINALLGFNAAVNTNNQQDIAAVLTAIRGNSIIPSQWFGSDIAKLKALVTEAKAKATYLLGTKNRILADWESDVLCLDYAPMLLRYKTEYTSFFKVFKSQYKQDKKQLQALSKTVIKKLPDEVASSLLLSLKEYHEQAAWFETNSTILTDALSSYYSGVESKWDDALAAIDALEKLKALPAAYITEALQSIVSQDHSKQIAALDERLSASMTAFAKIQNIISSGAIELGIDETDFNGKTAIEQIDIYLRKLDRIADETALLAPYLANEGVQVSAIYRAIESLNEHTRLSELLAAGKTTYEQHFGDHYTDRQTDWDNILMLLHQTETIIQMDMYEELKPIVNAEASRKKELKCIADEVSKLLSQASNHFEWVSAQFASDNFNQTMKLTEIYSKTQKCLAAMHMLGGWIDYQEAKDDCCTNGLEDFIAKIEAAKYHNEIERIFLKGFYHMWLGAVCDKSASVRRFRRNTHDERIKKFIELDDLQLLIAQMRIREKLIENLPSNHQLLKATDEVAILKKELSKKRNIMPLRKLFKQIPNLLLKLKPCLMMSPLSVSYFLETEAYHFDLVIFDEASQIFPEDAIGAIFRGSQVVIAGDSKQLPPTNFFAASTNNFDGDYDISGEEDFSEVISDSILEESASVLPNRTLLWHYRSKHENLIAFSNREIYKNNLITFPNSVTKIPDMGVEYIHVEDGYYEGGGKNCNIREAQKCVMLVLDHIQRHPDRSLGIIAFSEKQQTAIENAIIDFRERNPKYEWFFDESKDEPFFVKNLENVQGDERDTIIFSICYAKDRTGKMYMRFGPLGHEGGERRLNVAITRAKCNVKLVGSILPSDIDLSRTNSEGVRMLRSYIEFARQGTSALKPVENDEAFELKDDFCKVIVDFLRKHGYSVETEIGCSDYKIDIAVVNPDVEGEYIAGIECDGLSYVHAKTARDRDHLRRTILQNMGWNLYRVWSTEWMRNPAVEGEALLAFLHSVVGKDGKVRHAMKNSNDGSTGVAIEQIASETAKVVQKQSSVNPYGFAYYKEAKWWDTPRSGSNDNLTRISENVKYIVSVEQPMHMELLYKRMGPSFTTGKATEGVKNTIVEAINKRLNGQVRIDSDNFIRLLPETPIVVRIPERYDTPRPMEYIHTEEVATAMIKIIEHSFGITTEDLSTECARAFGFERKGPKIKLKTDAAIEYLVKSGKVKLIDGKAQLVGGR